MQLNDLNYRKSFKIWLLSCIFLLFFLISVGGLTRLTDSGLSITKWELFSGIFPPFTQEQWETYFSLYKKIPQYQLLNENMNMNEFKIIFFWEYFHRLLARLFGLIFIVPLIFFTIKNILKKEYLLNYYFIFGLICFQGFIGWYMVQSGLIDLVSVNHYRLAIHLIVAFVIISLLYWNYLNFKTNQKYFFVYNKNNKLFYFLYIFLLVQIILGAFVSGLDAGMIYQSWPLMGNNFFPNDISIHSFKNILDFNERSLVQFYHRVFAYLLFLYTLILGADIYLKNKTKIKKNFNFFFVILLIQVILGIYTLLSGLNITVSILHQFNGVILVLSSIKLIHKSFEINNILHSKII